MKKEFTNNLALGIFIGAVMTLFAIGIMASKPAPVKETPVPSSSLTFVTSRDGMKIYSIGNNLVVLGPNGDVSISAAYR
jgi:hypothetical protein